MPAPGALAEWLGSGLQSRLQQFESARRLSLLSFAAPCDAEAARPVYDRPLGRRLGSAAARTVGQGDDMSRVRKTLIAGALLALIGAAATSAAPASHRGGTLKLLAKAAGGTLDPQVNYTLQYWQLYQATYDGLLAFQKAGGDSAFNVVPDLAESLPKPTNGGKTWVFKLRKGIKFSNGQP